MAQNPMDKDGQPTRIPRSFYSTARKIIRQKNIQDFLADIAKEIATDANGAYGGNGFGIKRELYGDRVSVTVGTYSPGARQAEARDKVLTKAFAAARKVEPKT